MRAPTCARHLFLSVYASGISGLSAAAIALGTLIGSATDVALIAEG